MDRRQPEQGARLRLAEPRAAGQPGLGRRPLRRVGQPELRFDCQRHRPQP